MQARHRGGHSEAVPPKSLLVPPKRKLCPPKRGLCLEEINWLEATGVQIEAVDFQNSAYRRKIREQELFFGNILRHSRIF